jgi:phenylalanyl-tRNA synthetase beta chain
LLRNPLSADLDVMRQTLLFGGLESIAYNRNRKNPDLKLYEFGNTYFHLPERLQANNYLTAIKEEFKLALWFTGNSVSNNWSHPAEKTSVYELKAAVENVLLRLGVPAKKIVYKALNNDIFSSGLSIETVSNNKIGVLGVLQKAICKKFDIPSEVYFAELKWEALLQENANAKIKQREISKFPSVRRDLALLLDKNITFAEVEKIAYQADKKLLKDVTLFDVYEGKNLPEGKKSYAVSFILQDEETTLNDKQIDSLMAKTQQNLEQKLNATLR